MSALIEVSGLNKFYGEKHALNNIEFTINKGEPIALVGPNGAGKTTLLSILCGYIKPCSGKVSVFGDEPGKRGNLSRLAALPQDAQLDPRFSIAKQLTFYAQLQGLTKSQAKLEAYRTLKLVGLEDSINSKPSTLSHGMRKRVTIAQALIGEPEIVILDEATAGLDPHNAREIRSLVAELSSQTTFILSSHDLSELERLCNRVLYLEDGCLQQHHTLTNSTDTQFITLRMAQQQDDLIPALNQLSQVTQVINTQDKEYLISFNINESEVALDVQILQLCHQNAWLYRQLINGKTLENQLFN
ncbi:ABC transporter ATP-binding protein [Thalassotalea nanhaiensis]|uniref:ABC transporter ATP-binding protein n=1 Tax=Thalassotalea nanhaiensis TaxID=3065648 RepID=A0ABY9TN32_9GAMM|nr:ABC transporter ATP-binding protein [Colwelliaceae bacterium SQ345]